MVSARTAGIEALTIVRDERGAALKKANNRAYIAMLRRAAEHINAPHVLFVSHNEEIQTLADSRVTIEGGRFHVC